jgi:hypothetical protein
MQSGSQGFSGKRTVNALTMFDKLFTIDNNDDTMVDEIEEDSDDLMSQTIEV